jgi:RNA recognition motif-containing protein
MNRTLYVGNLPDSMTEARLSAKFSEHGKVSGVKLITDHRTGRNLGYGFVEMDRPATAQRVMEELDGVIYDGLQLTVRTAASPR